MKTISRRLLRPVAAPAPLRDMPATHTQPADWDALFSAVTLRLRLIAGTPVAASSTTQAQVAACRIQADLLDCVHALELLQDMLPTLRGQAEPASAPAATGEATAASQRNLLCERLADVATASTRREPSGYAFFDSCASS